MCFFLTIDNFFEGYSDAYGASRLASYQNKQKNPTVLQSNLIIVSGTYDTEISSFNFIAIFVLV